MDRSAQALAGAAAPDLTPTHESLCCRRRAVIIIIGKPQVALSPFGGLSKLVQVGGRSGECARWRSQGGPKTKG